MSTSGAAHASAFEAEAKKFVDVLGHCIQKDYGKSTLPFDVVVSIKAKAEHDAEQEAVAALAAEPRLCWEWVNGSFRQVPC
jgi:hypothetical protein